MPLEIAYNEGWDDTRGFSGNTYVGQTFTTIGSFFIEKVSFLFFRGDDPGIITCSLFAVDGNGLPTGDPIVSGTADGSTIPGFPGIWLDFVFSSVKKLQATTKYALVLSAPNPNALYFQDTSGAYAGGGRITSIDAGVTWNPEDASDLMFEVYSAENLVSELSFNRSQRGINLGIGRGII